MYRFVESRLKKWKEDPARKPLILKGTRQVGKTFLLKKFGDGNFQNSHYINFEKNTEAAKIFREDLTPEKILRDLSFHLNTAINTTRDLLIFDEIQNCPRALTSLKYFQEEKPELAICSAGSLLGVELSPESFPVGKVEFLNLYPMTFEEFLSVTDDQRGLEIFQNDPFSSPISEVAHEHLWEQLKCYFVVGGLPEVVKIFNEFKDDLYTAFQKVRGLQENLITAYVADIAKHSGKTNAMHVERVWKNVPQQLAREQNATAPKFKFKGIIDGVNRYSQLAGPIDWLIAAGLVIKIDIVNSAKLPFTAYCKENVFKLYDFDIGILGAIGELSPRTIIEYDYGSYKGYFAENFVVQELLAQTCKKPYGWSEGNSEIEFLLEHDGKIIPIEVKSGWVTKSKSIKNFIQKYNTTLGIILSAQRAQITAKHSIQKIPLYLVSKILSIAAH